MQGLVDPGLQEMHLLGEKSDSIKTRHQSDLQSKTRNIYNKLNYKCLLMKSGTEKITTTYHA